VVVRVTGRGEVGRGSRRRLRLPAGDLGFAAVDEGADTSARGAASVAPVAVADGGGMVHRPEFSARAS
jgi:hypothetical protein